MPHINELKESKFLRKEECGQGILVTIKEVCQENVAKEGAEPENKWCVHFAEVEKPLVLNSINAQLIAQIAKSEQTEHWDGVKVVLYADPTISFAGKIVGGIRVRAPRGKAAAQQNAPAPSKPAPVQAPTEDQAEDSEIPF